MTTIKKTLLKEACRGILIATCIYAVLFAALFAIEWAVPSLQGKLLQWTLEDGRPNWAFIIGIPASILGSGYVLTVRNPDNYMGFYPGILMSILLGAQMYLQHSYDLSFLYIAVFIPFQLASLVGWRKATLGSHKEKEPFTPKFVDHTGHIKIYLVALAIVVSDYVLATWVLTDAEHVGDWRWNPAIKILSGCTIASSILANFLMIRKKNDTWICWICYSIASIILFALLGNIFLVVLSVIMLVVNASGQIAWMRITHPDHYGWAHGHIRRTKEISAKAREAARRK